MNTSKAKPGKPASISAHPAFPAVVALWFAALLGLGCLVVPVVVFETLFSATGIAGVIPAAAPPLGPTARISISLAAALAGAGAGLFLARKVAAASGTVKEPRRREIVADDRTVAANPKRPISAREELGSDSFDAAFVAQREEQSEPAAAPARIAGRRRALSVTDESERSEFLDHAPLPGGEAAFDAHDDDEDRNAAFAQDAALDLGGFVEPETEPAAPETDEADDIFATLRLRMTQGNDTPQAAAAAETSDRLPGAMAEEAQLPPAVEATDEPLHAPAEPAHHAPELHIEDFPAMTSNPQTVGEAAYNPLAGFAPQDRPAPGPSLAAPAPAFAAPEPVATIGHNSGLHELGMVELVERFARALQKTQEPHETAPAPVPVSAPAQPAPPIAMANPIAAAAAEPVATGPIASPFPAQVPAYAPFSATAQAAQPSFVAPEPKAEPPMVFRRQPASAATVAPDAAELDAAPLAAPVPQMPQALRPFALHDDAADDEDEPLDLSFPKLNAAMARSEEPAFAAQEITADEEDGGESDSYSSLLSMKGRFAAPQPFVRIEDDEPVAAEEPVVVFPGQENRRAEPASDGPSRDPLDAGSWHAPAATPMRPFDAPSQATAAGARPAQPANSGETERALREALEKLQRMSGAG